jgi:hypothetical protein
MLSPLKYLDGTTSLPSAKWQPHSLLGLSSAAGGELRRRRRISVEMSFGYPQFCALKFSALKFSALKFSALKFSALKFSALKFTVVHSSTGKFNMVAYVVDNK